MPLVNQVSSPSALYVSNAVVVRKCYSRDSEELDRKGECVVLCTRCWGDDVQVYNVEGVERMVTVECRST